MSASSSLRFQVRSFTQSRDALEQLRAHRSRSRGSVPDPILRLAGVAAELEQLVLALGAVYLAVAFLLVILGEAP